MLSLYTLFIQMFLNFNTNLPGVQLTEHIELFVAATDDRSASDGSDESDEDERLWMFSKLNFFILPVCAAGAPALALFNFDGE